MNYSAQYTALITRALSRNRDPDQFFEHHHILPRSLGGKDTPDNIVLLTPREHYIAHLILAHIPGCENQWASVSAILQDTINPRRPSRFMHPKLRWKRWVRRRIAYQQAAWTREASKKQLRQAFNQRLALIEQHYIDEIFNAAEI